MKCQDSAHLKVLRCKLCECRKRSLFSPISSDTNVLQCCESKYPCRTRFVATSEKMTSKWIFNFMHLLPCWALSPQPGWGTMLLWPKRIFWDTEGFCELLLQTVPRLHTPQRGWSTPCRAGLAFRGGDCFWRKVLCFLQLLSSQQSCWFVLISSCLGDIKHWLQTTGWSGGTWKRLSALLEINVVMIPECRAEGNWAELLTHEGQSFYNMELHFLVLFE